MIVGAILLLAGWLLETVTSPLPTESLDLPSGSSLASSWGAQVGPINGFVPVDDVFAAIDLTLTLWLPAVLVYLGVNWIYRHIPVLGGGG